MTEITDRADVERILHDPAFVVAEADPTATRPADRFRARASRFANGAEHEGRRRRLEAMLAAMDPDVLATVARSRTRAGAGADAEEVAARVPVATLAERLGFAEPGAAPPLVAALADHYPTGSPSAAADAAAVRLVAAAREHAHPDTSATADADAREEDAALRVQLLVQAHAATAGLIAGALARPEAGDPDVPSAILVEAVLRDAPPVRRTRRISSEGDPLLLHLDGPDREAADAPRLLAFGAGPRACPASRHALAIATAVVDEVRGC